MRKQIRIVILAVGAGLLIGGGYFGYRNLRGAWPAITPPSGNIVNSFKNTNGVLSAPVNTTEFPLNVPAGFRIDIVASDLPKVRVLRFDGAGRLWASQPSAGRLTRLSFNESGAVTDRTVVFNDLDRPHGFVFDPDDADVIYIAEEGRVLRARISKPGDRTTLMTLPSDGGHSTRTIGLGPDRRLYVSIGSKCNVCRETNNRRATIWTMERDGANPSVYATGLRNTVFFIWHENDVWGTDMGRDLLGDDIPPDEVNIIRSGSDYGWPFCYGQRIHDRTFDDSEAAAARCRGSEPAWIDLPAHSAPLGLAFITDPAWPSDWLGDLLVAYHGSWNRSVPTGYKLVRHDLAEDQSPRGVTNFIDGWLDGTRALGRPVDLVFNGPALYVSDDHAGVIYRISPITD